MAHLFLRGGLRHDRMAALANLDLPPQLLDVVDAHQNLRGPYTAAGTIVRALAPTVLAEQPELTQRHDIELLSVAPELGDVLPNSRETLTSMALPAERTRFYARRRTLRTAHGLVEFLRDGVPPGRWALVIENVEHAEFTDHEFLAAALRRLDPDRLTLVLCAGDAELAEESLRDAVERFADTVPVTAGRRPEVTVPVDAAWQFILSDGTSDLPELLLGYQAADPTELVAMHDRRAAELAQAGEFSLKLGAIGYHLERGSDPSETGARALFDAQDHCVCLGFYTAVVGYATRAMPLIDPRTQEKLWWAIASGLGLSWSILGDTHEALDLYNQVRLNSIRPEVHMAANYSIAMLYTRHNDPAERDEKIAKGWLHSSIATASLMRDRVERAFSTAFYSNGLALVEVNLGDLNEALRLVNNCIDSLDEQLMPDEHRLHRAVLKNNRARVYNGLRQLDAALADYGAVIAEDPNHCEHYLERGNILRSLGRYDEAAADYAKAVALTPPFPEIHYNRGDLRLLTGDVDGALADFSYVLELDPDFVDAYVNRAGIYLDAGEFDAAFADAVQGLRSEPANAYLHAVLAQVHAERGETAAAAAAYDAALAADPKLVTALSGRATLAYERGDFDSALADLTRAVELDPTDAALRYNRGYLQLEASRWDEALADLTIAAELTPEDEDIAEARQTCLRQLETPSHA